MADGRWHFSVVKIGKGCMQPPGPVKIDSVSSGPYQDILITLEVDCEGLDQLRQFSECKQRSILVGQVINCGTSLFQFCIHRATMEIVTLEPKAKRQGRAPAVLPEPHF